MDRDEQAARNMALFEMRRPQDFKLWEVEHPNGCKLIEAIYALTLPNWRKSVADFLANVAVGLSSDRERAMMQDHFWRHILYRLQAGELVMRGRRDGGDQENVPPDMLDDAEPDFATNRVTCGSVVFRAIRIFEAANVTGLARASSPTAVSASASPQIVRGYAAKDAPLIQRMATMVSTGEASGPMDAARAVVKDAAGAGTEESKVKRLTDRFVQLKSSGQY